MRIGQAIKAQNVSNPLVVRRGGVCAAIVVVFVLGRSVTAQNECDDVWQPERVSDPAMVVTQISLALDSASNAFAAGVTDDTLVFGVVGNGGVLAAVSGFDGGVEADPSFASGELGATTMVLTQLTTGEEAFGREVFLTHRIAGSFNGTENISNNRVDDYAARLVLDRNGDPHVVWAQRSGVTSRVMYWNEDVDAPEQVASVGDMPSLFVGLDGVVHVVYLSGNDVFYTNNRGRSFAAGQAVTSSPLTPETALSVGVDSNDAVVVAYESVHSLYLAVKTGAAEFDPPGLIVSGGVLDPNVRFKVGGSLALAYVRDGDVYYVQGDADALGEPKRLTDTPEVESQPTVDIDRHSILHATFLRGGAVYYANNACTPEPEFSATVHGGRAPLDVQFSDETSGLVSFWSWDFGDGNLSSSRDPLHTYNESGKFTVTLRVWGPGGVSSEIVKEEFISVGLAANSFEMVDHRVLPGDSEVWMPVYATVAESFQGYQLMARFDPSFLDLNRMELSSTVLENLQLDPDFQLATDRGFFFEVGVLLELHAPFENLSIPPIVSQPIANLIFDVLPTARPGETTKVSLRDDPMISEIRNLVIVDGFNRVPALVSATVQIASDPTLVDFLRGEVTGDGMTDISDGIATLNYLFSSGQALNCLDAADFDDDGRLNIGDAISVFNYLFAGGQRPAPPFPMPGLDPTPDDELGECR